MLLQGLFLMYTDAGRVASRRGKLSLIQLSNIVLYIFIKVSKLKNKILDGQIIVHYE